MSYFVYQGKNIYYTSEGGGMPMLFLHGNTASLMMFEMFVSRADEMLANDMAAECAQLSAANPLIRYKIYEDGAHPLILSKAEEIARVGKRFLLEA